MNASFIFYSSFNILFVYIICQWESTLSRYQIDAPNLNPYTVSLLYKIKNKIKNPPARYNFMIW